MDKIGDAHCWAEFSHCRIASHDIVTASRKELTHAMVQDCLLSRNGRTKPRLVFDVNGHGVSLYKADSSYRRAVDNADIVHADGGFLITLSRWCTKTPIAERSATTDLIHDFAAAAAKHGLRFFLLGGTEAVNAECAQRLTSMYPGLRIVGRHHGYFGRDEEELLIKEINRLQPDVVWVGLGKPKEQEFCIKWRDTIRCGWLVTCGGCYNYITEHYARAPIWVQNANMEWLHRLIRNPRKLLWRYLATTPHALWIVFWSLVGESHESAPTKLGSRSEEI